MILAEPIRDSYRVSAIVLAAGDSIRMGVPKALLPDRRGRPFLLRILDTLAAADLRRAVVVAGRHFDDIQELIRGSSVAIPATLVRNPDPARGQLSSLHVGMDVAIDAMTDCVLVTLVDVPAVAAATCSTLVDAWRHSRAAIVRPQVGSRHGHPVIFDRGIFAELRAAPIDQGARAVVHADPTRLLNVPVDDPGCLVDVDTPDDYARLRT